MGDEMKPRRPASFADQKHEVRLLIALDSGGLSEARGEPFCLEEIPEVGFIVRKISFGWQVDEVSSGRWVSQGNSRQEAIANARAKFTAHTLATIDLVLTRYKEEIRSTIAAEPSHRVRP